MKTKKKVSKLTSRKPRPVPRIEVYEVRRKIGVNKFVTEFDYRIIGKNSKTLIHCNQGFKRLDRLFNNIMAVYEVLTPGITHSVQVKPTVGLPYGYRLEVFHGEYRYIPIYVSRLNRIFGKG